MSTILTVVHSNIFNVKTAKEIIVSTFGNEYTRIADRIQSFKSAQYDFMVKNKAFNDLTSEEMQLTRYISQWRHHAFEWIVGDDEWDEVELNT